MSLPEERLWRFRKPEWLNSIWARNAGVYTAGGLVRLPLSPSLPSLVSFKANSQSPVLPRLLPPPRLRRLVQILPQRLHHPRRLRRLAALHLFGSGHARDQQHREISPLLRVLQLHGVSIERRVEGARHFVSRVRQPGGRHGGRCDGFRAEVRRAGRAVAGAGDGGREFGGEFFGWIEYGCVVGESEYGG